MALLIGDIVSPHLVSGTVQAQPQPPTFGVVDAAEGDINVLWEDGRLVANLDPQALDKIEAPTADALSGQRVIINLAPSASFQASSDFQGDVIDVFRRDQGDGDNPTADLVLVKLLSSGLYFEVLASRVTVVPVGT